MNFEDLQNRIEASCKNARVPDSLLPERVEERLSKGRPVKRGTAGVRAAAAVAVILAAAGAVKLGVGDAKDGGTKAQETAEAEAGDKSGSSAGDLYGGEPSDGALSGGKAAETEKSQEADGDTEMEGSPETDGDTEMEESGEADSAAAAEVRTGDVIYRLSERGFSIFIVSGEAETFAGEVEASNGAKPEALSLEDGHLILTASLPGTPSATQTEIYILTDPVEPELAGVESGERKE